VDNLSGGGGKYLKTDPAMPRRFRKMKEKKGMEKKAKRGKGQGLVHTENTKERIRAGGGDPDGIILVPTVGGFRREKVESDGDYGQERGEEEKGNQGWHPQNGEARTELFVGNPRSQEGGGVTPTI